jgi:NADH-quinone oxidoreductase subunit L
LFWIVGVIAAGMTAFYMTRQVILTFFGEFRGGEKMASYLHESPSSMTIPLIVLAVGSILAGYVGLPFGASLIGPFLAPALNAGMPIEAEAHHASVAVELMFMAGSVLVGLAAIFLAYRMYWGKPDGDKAVSEGYPGIYRTLYNKYFVDEIYGASVVDGTLEGAKGLHWIDANVVDGAVNGAAELTLGVSELSNLADASLVDGLVNAVWKILASISAGFRQLQTGVLQNYALMMLVGIGALIGFFYYYLWT